MKPGIRRLLVAASVLGVVTATGLVLARPSPKKPDVTAKRKDADSVQVTVTTSGKGRLGVAALQISPELRQHLGAPDDRGVLVDAVRADSPAAKAGLQVGDVIAEVDGDATESATDILQAMSDRKKGDAVRLVVLRDRNRLELTATLEEDPSATTTHRLGAGDLDQHLGRMLRDMPSMGSWGDDDMQRQLEDANRRIDELEKRLDKRAP